MRSKRLTAIVLSVATVVSTMSIPNVTYAKDTKVPLNELRQNYCAMSFEGFTLGKGYFVEPRLVQTGGEKLAVLTNQVLDENGIQYSYTGSVEGNDIYYSALGFDAGNLSESDLPEYYKNVSDFSIDDYSNDAMLGEFDYTSYSGWMITANNAFIPVGAGAWETNPGDTYRWMFTLWGYGADLGVDSGWGQTPYYTEANKSNLIYELAAINSYYGNTDSDSVYEDALRVAISPYSTQDEVDSTADNLSDYIAYYVANGHYESENGGGSQNSSNDTGTTYGIDVMQNKVISLLKEKVTDPAFGSIGGEWVALSLGRCGAYTDEWRNKYLASVEASVATAVASTGSNKLHKTKSTENSRAIIGLTSVDYDAANVNGVDLCEPLATDFTWVTKQGINGPIYALIALDYSDYYLEGEKDITTAENDISIRDDCLRYILGSEMADGGWALSGTSADPDITAMAIQALSTYYDKDESVKAAVDRALNKLSSIQNEDGGYASWGTVNSESISQVICALTSLGINPVNDSRFVKNKNLLQALESFMVEEGDNIGFAHTGTSYNQMATEQAAYAIVAMNKLMSGEKLYQPGSAGSAGEDPAKSRLFSFTVDTAEADGSIKTKTYGHIRANENVADAKILDLEIAVPSEVEVVSVESDVEGNIEYAVNNGILRVTLASLDDRSLGIVTGKDIVKIEFGASIAGEYDVKINHFVLRKSSEEEVSTGMEGTYKVKVLDSMSIAASVLYQGTSKSEFIPSDKMAVKIILSDAVSSQGTVVFTKEGKDYICYVSKDFSTDSKKVYVAVVDQSVTIDDLQNVDNYSVSKDKNDAIIFGDTNYNGEITSADALEVVRLWVGKSKPEISSRLVLSYNVTGDDTINNADTLAIIEHITDSKDWKVIGN